MSIDAWLSAKEFITGRGARLVQKISDVPQPPDCVCIGAQKAGTTWLYQNLQDHPSFFVPPVKEINYFSSIYLDGFAIDDTTHRKKQARDAEIWWKNCDRNEEEKRHALDVINIVKSSQLSDLWYSSIFKYTNNEQISIDISPNYSILPQSGIKHLLRINPNVKILALIRDPAERYLSHAQMLRQTLGIGSVRTIIDSEAHYMMSCFSDYGRWLARWSRSVPSSNILLKSYKSIESKPTKLLKEICIFLGVPFHEEIFPLAYKKIHSGQRDEISYQANYEYVRKILEPQYTEFYERFPTFEFVER